MIVPVYLRPVSRNTATLIAIGILHGDESEEVWARVLDTLSESLTKRIVALVSDDSLGLARYARGRTWIHQRCHFHLAARFRAILGRRKRIQFRKERERAWKLVSFVVTEPQVWKIGLAMRELRAIGKNKRLSYFLRLRVNGFLRNWHEYRTYMMYPQFRLPTTSNAAESGGSIARSLLRVRRGFKTMRSLRRWIETIKLLHPTMTCKRTKIQQN
jgi:transposase-like protein